MMKYDRKKTAKIVGGMLCLTLALASLAGCKSSEKSFGLNSERLDKTRAAIQVEIPDAERQQALLAVVADFEMETQSIVDEVTALRAKIVEANRDYDTTREQLQKLYDGIGVQLERLGNATKEYRFKLRELCSEAEWDEIFDHDDDAVEFKF